PDRPRGPGLSATRLLEPLGDETIVGVDVMRAVLAERHELVRHERRRHEDLARGDLGDVVTDREARRALVDDEGLVVGMPVQPRSDALPRDALEDDRDARAEEIPLEIAVLELGLLDDPNRHVVVPLAGVAAVSSAPPVGARDTRR